MNKMILSSVKMLLIATVCILMVSQPALANSQSVNVAVIGSLGSSNGGTLPSDIGITGLGITFTNLAPASVSTASLATYDTVVLNVASSQMGETTATLSTDAKEDLVAFVGNGGKLIIYDSECASADYSWLPYPFTTVNPGQQGATGTLFIVEENTLSSNDPLNTFYYIDAAYLASHTDAVGDMNVMTTYDPNWCLDMSGTNVVPATGPVHTYAEYTTGTNYGLIIYNGLDIDCISTSSSNILRKIWILELMQPFNPSGLPQSHTVVGINLGPDGAVNTVNTDHTVTATLEDVTGAPIVGTNVDFLVVSGPNAGDSGTDTTDASGKASFTYTGDGGVGIDTIVASFYNGVTTVDSQTVTKEWKLDTQVPEFPTVALPMVAILGLMFLFQRRKE